MKRAIVFIDGENFRFKLIESSKISTKKLPSEIANIDLSSLIINIVKPIPDISFEIRFYSAKIHVHQESYTKSRYLADRQRVLKSQLEAHNIKYVIAGHVRPQLDKRRKELIYKEKGVDVRMAVDMVALAYKSEVDIIVLCSSDSDLKPAVEEVKNCGVEVVYLEFKVNPNKGLMHAADRCSLIDDNDILRTEI